MKIFEVIPIKERHCLKLKDIAWICYLLDCDFNDGDKLSEFLKSAECMYLVASRVLNITTEQVTKQFPIQEELVKFVFDIYINSGLFGNQETIIDEEFEQIKNEVKGVNTSMDFVTGLALYLVEFGLSFEQISELTLLQMKCIRDYNTIKNKQMEEQSPSSSVKGTGGSAQSIEILHKAMALAAKRQAEIDKGKANE